MSHSILDAAKTLEDAISETYDKVMREYFQGVYSNSHRAPKAGEMARFGGEYANVYDKVASEYSPHVPQWVVDAITQRVAEKVDATQQARKTCPQCHPKYQDYLRADEDVCWRCGRRDLVSA